MVRLISLSKRPAGYSLADWRQQAGQRRVDAQWLRRLWESGCQRWVGSQVRDEDYAHAEPEADWVDEYDFHQLSQARAWRDFLQLQENAGAPSGLHVLVHVVVQKAPVLEPACNAAGLKVVRFAKRSPGMAPAAFRAYWKDAHGPIACASPMLRRYEQLHTVDEEYAGKAPAWDGFTLSWFESPAALIAHAQHPAGQAAARDTQHFLAAEPLPVLKVEQVGGLTPGEGCTAST